MEIAEAKNQYNALDLDQKRDFLVRLSHALTITGRECYELDGDGLEHPKSLRTLNEVQHRIMGAIIELGTISPTDETRDWVIELVLSHDNALLKARSSWAFESAISIVSSEK